MNQCDTSLEKVWRAGHPLIGGFVPAWICRKLGAVRMYRVMHENSVPLHPVVEWRQKHWRLSLFLPYRATVWLADRKEARELHWDNPPYDPNDLEA